MQRRAEEVEDAECLNNKNKTNRRRISKGIPLPMFHGDIVQAHLVQRCNLLVLYWILARPRRILGDIVLCLKTLSRNACSISGFEFLICH